MPLDQWVQAADTAPYTPIQKSVLASFSEASALGAGAVHGSVCVVAALPPAPSLRTITLPPSVSLFVFIGSLP